MTAISPTGKYRQRKDWSTNSIPQLVSLEEEAAMAANGKQITNVTDDADILMPQVTTKPPRRSSLAFGLLAGRGNSGDKLNKRRSSISTFLGRRESNTKITHKENTTAYEYAMKSEKFDGLSSYDTPTIRTEILNCTDTNESFDSQNDENNTLDNKSHQNIYEKNSGYLSPVTKDRQRRFSTSWQHKLERRRRKNNNIDDTQILSIQELQLQQQRKRSTGDFIKSTLDGGGVEEPPIFNRQKRHSWWNIFVPEKQRSRRASQDVSLMSRSADCLAPPTRRSKSRSVDHGLAAPFDLDSLRSKVEGRFESIDRLSKDGDKKKSSLPTIPTITYTVGNRDTLTSVAARFDTTPSELTHLNRLNSSFIFPGQQLLVPDKSKAEGSAEGADASSTATTGSGGDDEVSGKSSPVERKSSKEESVLEEKDFLEGLRPSSPKPGHIERVNSSKGTGSDATDDPVITQRFLKINVRHITDGQGVVGGVLLVTPNAVMFDPNVSDPLVIEHGPESYGVIAPMELVVNAAIFHDIAHMRVGGGESQSNEKVEIYYPKSCKSCTNALSPGKDSLLVKDDTFPELGSSSVETCDDQESVSSNNERDGNAFPKAFDRDRVTPTNLTKEASETNETCDSEKPSSELETKDSSKSDSNESTQPEISDLIKKPSTLEERRKSLLDHHWAIPNKDRKSLYNSQRSSDEEGDSENNRESMDHTSGSKDELLHDNSIPSTNSSQLHQQHQQAGGSSDREPSESNESDLTKHDSGIDIRDPNAILVVQSIQTKKVYSDADLVLSSEWAPPRTVSPTHISESPPTGGHLIAALNQTQSVETTAGGGRKKTSSVSFSVEDNDQSQSSSDKSTHDQNKKTKMLKRLSYPLTWVEGLTSDGSRPADNSDNSAPNTGDSNQSVFSKVFSSSPITLVSELGGNLFLSKTPSEESGGSPVPPHTPHSEGHNTPAGRSSIGTFIRPHSSEGSHSSSKPTKVQPKLDYRSMVSIDDMPELFVSFDKLIPRPARACPDPPMYLRLRMGRPIGKTIPLPTSVMSYGKNKLRPEYWFSVPQNRIDELYRFVNTWVPYLYGELNEEKIKARGFELIEHDTEWVKGQTVKGVRQSSEGEDISELTRESWQLLKAPFVKTYNIIKTAGSHDLDLLGGEVLSMSTDDYRKASQFQTGSFDLDFPIPDLIGQTEILTEEHREKLCAHLPARAEGYSWSLVFSTSHNGFSLNSLYRKMQKLESPILIVIEDTEHNVFGALTSCSLHVSDLFYGTGESLLYKFNPSFKVFHWTGENLYFIKGNPESLSIGAGDGKFGLWLDGDLNQGRSQTCNTYANEPLAPQEDFVIKTLECWAFV